MADGYGARGFHPDPEWLRFRELRKKLESMEGWAFRAAMANLARSQRICVANWAMFDSVAGRFKRDSEFALSVWGGSMQNEERWATFLEALDVALHNFVASAFAVLEHTRTVADTHLRGEAHEVRLEKYRETFEKPSLPAFVRGLRHYLLHYAPSYARGTLDLSMEDLGEGFTMAHRIVLDLAEMKSWRRWKLKARAYIDECGATVDLHEVMSAFNDILAEYQNWFVAFAFESNREKLDEFNAVALEHDAIIEKVRRVLLENQ